MIGTYEVGKQNILFEIFIIEVFQGFLFSVCHTCATPPVLKFGIVIHSVCSNIGDVKTLGRFRHWVCSNKGYVQTLVKISHWVFFLIF